MSMHACSRPEGACPVVCVSACSTREAHRLASPALQHQHEPHAHKDKSCRGHAQRQQILCGFLQPNSHAHLSPSADVPPASLMALSRRLSTFCRTSHEGGRVLKPPSSSLQAASHGPAVQWLRLLSGCWQLAAAVSCFDAPKMCHCKTDCPGRSKMPLPLPSTPGETHSLSAALLEGLRVPGMVAGRF